MCLERYTVQIPDDRSRFLGYLGPTMTDSVLYKINSVIGRIKCSNLWQFLGKPSKSSSKNILHGKDLVSCQTNVSNDSLSLRPHTLRIRRTTFGATDVAPLVNSSPFNPLFPFCFFLNNHLSVRVRVCVRMCVDGLKLLPRLPLLLYPLPDGTFPVVI